MGPFFSHLECSVPCGAGPADPREPHQRCRCGAPLVARYDLTAAKRWARTSLATRDASMWRYREILPLLKSSKGLDPPITLGEGWTPLVRARRLGATLGLKRLYIKDDSHGPTGSWKARGLSAAMTRAVHLGVTTVGIATAGRSAKAAAAYAARAGLKLEILTPEGDHTGALQADVALYAPKVTTVEGTLADAEQRALSQASAPGGWYDCSAGAEPYQLEGQKTIGYEIAEQLAWELPDWIICPAATGVTLVGIAKAYLEMAALAWIDPVRRPHLVAVQAAGCAPLVRAHASGAAQADPWATAAVRTSVSDLRVPAPPLAEMALRAIRDTGGHAVGAGDMEMVKEAKTIARLEGISASGGAGAALHALRVLTSEGRIRAHDTVVIVNPGSVSLPGTSPRSLPPG